MHMHWKIMSKKRENFNLSKKNPWEEFKLHANPRLCKQFVWFGEYSFKECSFTYRKIEIYWEFIINSKFNKLFCYSINIHFSPQPTLLKREKKLTKALTFQLKVFLFFLFHEFYTILCHQVIAIFMCNKKVSDKFPFYIADQ